MCVCVARKSSSRNERRVKNGETHAQSTVDSEMIRLNERAERQLLRFARVIINARRHFVRVNEFGTLGRPNVRARTVDRAAGSIARVDGEYHS